jgi:hypothetical protein
MKEFIKSMLRGESGISSKRVCGVLGWLVSIGIILYCTTTNQQAPEIMDTFILGIMGLLGIDSVTGIWKGKS